MSKTQIVESIPLRRGPVDVGVLVELTTEMMRRQARERGVALTIHIDDNVPDVVHLDRDKVAWAVTNLMGSALRHVHTPGGSINIDVSYDAARSTLSIAVRDDGPGIPPYSLGRLLNRTAWHPGAALALLLVEDIAVAHGGGLEIESETGSVHFTTVRLTIRVG
jgi:signal transduction histidine kinase